MERKLEHRDTSGYIPYNVYLHYFKDEAIRIKPLVCYDRNRGVYYADMCLYRDCVHDKHSPKLVLRPFDDLYRTITHNEKEIIPIVELAKISMNCVVSGEWILDEDGEAINEECELAFGYNWAGGDFYCYSTRRAGDFYTPRFQHRLFDYLHELKIDYRGLINAGLAISVYDLDTNPYK